MSDTDPTAAALDALAEAELRNRAALRRLADHQAATANLRLWPHRHNGIPDGPDPTKIREAKP